MEAERLYHQVLNHLPYPRSRVHLHLPYMAQFMPLSFFSYKSVSDPRYIVRA